MSIRLEFYDGTKTYMFPNGALATPEAMAEKVPAIDSFKHILEINGNVCGAIQEFEAMKNIYGERYSLDFTGKTDDEALAMMQTALNTPVVADTTPTTEERIAAALEYSNVLAMPDVTA